MDRKNYIDVVAHYDVKIEYDSIGELFDINISDGVHSISTEDFDSISRIIKELEERYS